MTSNKSDFVGQNVLSEPDFFLFVCFSSWTPFAPGDRTDTIQALVLAGFSSGKLYHKDDKLLIFF